MSTKQNTREGVQYQSLLRFCQSEKQISVAFSGGVDSTLLAKAAFDALGSRALALTLRSELMSSRERDDVEKFAHQIGIKHDWVDMSLSDIPNIQDNPRDRCYHCKKAMLSRLMAEAEKRQLMPLAEAGNTDDLRDVRPGMRAVSELKILSPFLELGISKKDIRAMSTMLGLPTANKPSFACLASRIPYGEEISSEKLKQVDQAESYLFSLGLNQLRVRHHGKIARIEVPENDVLLLISQRKIIESTIRSFGFDFVCLDLDPFSSGKFNHV